MIKKVLVLLIIDISEWRRKEKCTKPNYSFFLMNKILLYNFLWEGIVEQVD